MGGGASVLAADECESAGLEMPPLPDRIRRELLEYTPSVGVGLRNPLDLDTDGFMNAELSARSVRVLSEWEGVDFLLLVILPGVLLAHSHINALGGHVKALTEVARQVKKPLLVVLRTGGLSKSECAAAGLQAEFQKAGFPVFRSVDAAARAAVRLISYNEWRHL
mgnify:CR=1 FL=1